jgi:Flp pilus assembly protein TadG
MSCAPVVRRCRAAFAARHAAMRAAAHDDRGASPVELAILVPAILLLLFGAIQVASVFIARAVALTAAQEAVTAQRAYEAPAGVGQAQAMSFLAKAGDWLTGPTVSQPQSSATEVRFTVTGTALSVVPGVTFTVSQTAHGTVERFTLD